MRVPRLSAVVLCLLGSGALARAPRAERDEDWSAPLPRQGTLTLHLEGAVSRKGPGGKTTLLAWGSVQPLEDVPIRHGVLLASRDGGKSWQERLPPQQNIEVLAVVPAGAHWRAVLGWTLEGPGALWLYAGRDLEHAFKKVAEIPKPGNLDELTHATFSSEREGCVFLTNDAEEVTRSLSTHDGGKHWSASAVPCAEPELKADAFQEAGERQHLEWHEGGALDLPLKWQRTGERWTPVSTPSGKRGR